MKPTLEERILATGETLERVRQWESIIETIAAKTGEPTDDVASTILLPLATEKVMLADCYKLQEIGVRLSNYFMTHVASENAGSNSLFHELTQMGYNSEKKKKDFTAAWDYGIKLVTGKKADDAHRTVESDGTLKQNRNTDFKIHTAQDDSAPDKSQEQAMKPSDIQTAAYINKHARIGDIYEDKNRTEWRCEVMPWEEHDLEGDVLGWVTPSRDRVYILPAEGEPYSLVSRKSVVSKSEEVSSEIESVEIYSDAVVIDGSLMSFSPDSVKLGDRTSAEESLKVSIELEPKKVSLHNRAYDNDQRTENRG